MNQEIISFVNENEFSKKLSIDDNFALENSKSLADKDRNTKIFSEFQDDDKLVTYSVSKQETNKENDKTCPILQNNNEINDSSNDPKNAKTQNNNSGKSDTIMQLLEISKDTNDWKEITQVIYH